MFNPECELIGIDYDQPFDMSSIGLLEIIYMVDFSLPVAQMLELQDFSELIWIDHHKTAMEAKELAGVLGKRGVDFSGCELAWMYFAPGTPMPPAVYLLGRYDVWDHSANPDVLPFQYGMKKFKSTAPERAGWLWQMLFSAGWDDTIIKEICEAGRYIEDYERSKSAFAAGITAFETYFAGHRAIAMNVWPASSIMFASVFDPARHDIMVAFGIVRGKWSVSVYGGNNEVDAGEIVKRYGGGGHKSAAGFVSDVLPFSCGVDEVAA
jgi:oligoribonuclease NrnB/cAMP/cGMP phosphodiesterase (DHH superfamily)